MKMTLELFAAYPRGDGTLVILWEYRESETAEDLIVNS